MTSEKREIHSQLQLKGVEINLVPTWNKTHWHCGLVGQITGNSFLPLGCREFVVCQEERHQAVQFPSCTEEETEPGGNQTISSRRITRHVSAKEASIVPALL